MKVVILCGGVGSRLREETEFRPKPMVPIGEQPILWHIMHHYAHFGHKEFILALGYKGEMIREYFLSYHALTQDCTVNIGEHNEVEFHASDRDIDDWKVTLVDTGLNTLKGGRMKRLSKYIPESDDHFLMTYGDGVCNLNINDEIDFHKGHGGKVTVTGVIPSMRFGEIRSRDDGSVEFREKDRAQSAMINGGYYVINREVLDLLSEDESQDFEYGPLEDLSDEGQVRMLRHENFWHCMDNVRDMEALNQMWAENKAPWKIWK